MSRHNTNKNLKQIIKNNGDENGVGIPQRLNGLDLFSGIGGNTLALRKYIKTIAYCEFDRHAQGVLLSRMRSGDIEPAPIWDDIKTLTKGQFACNIDIIVGGFPCQDISVAGKGAGITQETRSGLFFEVMRLARELKPTFIFLENVPAIRTRGLDIVLQELTKAGYDCRWTMLSASDIGANHKRERWFLLAHDNSSKLREQSGRSGGENWEKEIVSSDNGPKEHVANTESKQSGGVQLQRIFANSASSGFTESGENSNGVEPKFENISDQRWWQVEPNVGRVANEFPFRVDRLKRLGNSVVPQQAKKAFEILAGIEQEIKHSMEQLKDERDEG